MILFKKPDRQRIDAFIARQSQEPFNYAHIGRTQEPPLPGYIVDHNRALLGEGEATFSAACQALKRWQMFNTGWVQLCWPDAPIQEGTTVAILVKIFGLWWLNASRIVYLIDETNPIRRHGFAYGTLTDHAESGEERFTIELQQDGTVWYDLLAYSRPHHPLAKIGRPLARRTQKRFASASLAAMQRGVG